jgi:hypothetical protein
MTSMTKRWADLPCVVEYTTGGIGSVMLRGLRGGRNYGGRRPLPSACYSYHWCSTSGDRCRGEGGSGPSYDLHHKNSERGDAARRAGRAKEGLDEASCSVTRTACGCCNRDALAGPISRERVRCAFRHCRPGKSSWSRSHQVPYSRRRRCFHAVRRVPTLARWSK